MKLGIITKAAISLILLIVLFSLIEWDELLVVVHHARVEFLFAMVVLWPISIMLSSIKLNRILKGYGIKQPIKDTFMLYWVGSFFNNFIPSSVGGDAYKFFTMKKVWPERKNEIASSMAMERIVGLCVMLPFPLVLGIGFLSLNQQFDLVYWSYLMFVLAIIFLVALGWLTIVHLNNGIKTSFKLSIAEKFTLALGVFFSYRDRNGLIIAALLSVGFFFLSSYAYQLCFMAYGEHISLTQIMIIMPMIAVAKVIPISINGLGVTEGLSVFLFSMFGISIEVAIAVSFTGRILLMIVSASGGIVYLIYKPHQISNKHI